MPSTFVRYKVFLIEFVVGFFLLLSLLAIFLPHRENDEVIYQTLGIKLSRLEPYNLEGSEILKILPPEVYNTQIFFRPPAFAFYLALWYRLLGTIGMYLAPVSIYILLCFVVYKTVSLLTNSPPVRLKALLFSVVSTPFVFFSTKIHLDLFSALMVTIAIFFLISFKEREKSSSILLSGLFLVLAVFTKYTVLVIYPVFAVFLLITAKKRLLSLLLFFLTAMLLVPWFYYLFFVVHLKMDVLVSVPNQTMLANFPFVRYVSQRPFFFYFLNIFLVNPLYVLFLLLFKKSVWSDLVHKYGYIFYFLLSSVLIVLVALTVYGMRGGSYQMRYIILSEPFFVILFSLLPWEKYKILRWVVIAFVIHNLLLFFLNLNRPELFSLGEMMLMKK